MNFLSCLSARVRYCRGYLFLNGFAGLALLVTGCATPQPTAFGPGRPEPAAQTLTPGDVIQISFPGAPNLETKQQIRRDGRINLAMVGEIKASDKTPAELEKELIQAYSSQLVSKEIKVMVVASSYSVLVTGAVIRPGKIVPDRTLTAFDAIMEAGGFDSTRADTKSVRVIRQVDGEIKNYVLNLKDILDGARAQPFYLQANDVVYVPERFSWF
jgi:polysaccharide biosynthesis/export protein